MRRSRLIGLLFVLFLTPLVVAGGVMLRAHRLLADPTTLARIFSVGLGQGVASDSFDVVLWPPGIVLRGVELADRSKYGSGELAHVDAVWLQAGIPALFRGEVTIVEVVLEKPTLRVVLGPEGWNLGASEQYLETPDAFDVQRVTASGLRLVYRDRTRPGVAEFELRNGSFSAVRSGGDEGWALEVRGVTDGSGTPEAPPGSVELRLKTPSADEGRVRIEGSVEGLDAARVGEMAQLIGSDMPFGSRLLGSLSGQLRGDIGTGVAVNDTRVRVDLDLEQAELLTREGWVLKPRGLPSRVQLDGTYGESNLQLEGFEAQAATLKIRARRQAATDALVLEATDLDGRALENVLPLLAAVRPRGRMQLSGRVERTEEGRQLNLDLRGKDLTLLPEEDRWTLAQFSLGLGLHSGGQYLLVTRAQDVQGQDFALESFSLGYLGRSEGAPLVDLHARGLQRHGARLDDLWVNGEVTGDLTGDRMLAGGVAVRGFGGDGAGTGSLRRLDAGWSSALDFGWQSMAIAPLETFLDLDTGVRGIVSGNLSLVADGADSEAMVAGMQGPLSWSVAQARFAGAEPLQLASGALARIPLVGARLKRRLAKAGRQMEVSGSDSASLRASGRWADSRYRVATLQLSGSSYGFSGAGEISSNGAVALIGDMSLQGRIADDLRQGDLGLNVILGDSGPIVFPVQVDGEYPVLSVVPEAAFLQELSGRARRSLGGGLGQQLREALRP